MCPIDLQERVTSTFGAPLYNFWGASEVVGSLTFGLENGPVVRIVEGAQVRLVDEAGADVPHGEIGELLIRGANVFAGYWNDPAATEQSLKAGWYHTGDLMRRGEGDDLWFVSRKKDIIIRGGTNISPVEVEEALVASHPAVEEAAVVGTPDAVLGQRVFGFVKLCSRHEEDRRRRNPSECCEAPRVLQGPGRPPGARRIAAQRVGQSRSQPVAGNDLRR